MDHGSLLVKMIETLEDGFGRDILTSSDNGGGWGSIGVAYVL